MPSKYEDKKAALQDRLTALAADAARITKKQADTQAQIADVDAKIAAEAGAEK
jgi:hypothetical protein